MNNDQGVMRYEAYLPEGFTGTFHFSNPSDRDFIGVWGGKQYLFPAQKTVPLVMAEYSPLEIQHIRKEFAKDLAEREFYYSRGYEVLRGQEGTPGNRVLNSIHQAAAYTLHDLEPYIQACLKPLETSALLSKPVEKVDIEELLHKTDDGETVTQAIDKKTSLRKKALEA